MACEHDFIYYNTLNIFNRSDLLETFDSWRCRKCGMIRLGVREIGSEPPAKTLPDPENPEEKWIILVCMAGDRAKVEAYSVKEGDIVEHKCINGTTKFKIGEDLLPEKTVKEHYFYRFEDVAGGYIDVSENPPKVVAIRR